MTMSLCTKPSSLKQVPQFGVEELRNWNADFEPNLKTSYVGLFI